MITTTIPIEGTFDIAKGRSSLRTHIAIHRWPPVFGARASAALTALGELILASGINHVVVIKLEMIADGDEKGIVFGLVLPLLDVDLPRMDQALTRVERATNNLDIQSLAKSSHITARLLVTDSVKAHS